MQIAFTALAFLLAAFDLLKAIDPGSSLVRFEGLSALFQGYFTRDFLLFALLNGCFEPAQKNLLLLQAQRQNLFLQLFPERERRHGFGG